MCISSACPAYPVHILCISRSGSEPVDPRPPALPVSPPRSAQADVRIPAAADDSRIIHWGSENFGHAPRHMVSFTYAHGWYTETGRDLTPAAVDEAVSWRDEWAREWQKAAPIAGAADAPPRVVGSLSEAMLRRTHETLRSMRDETEREQWLLKGIGLALVLYSLAQSFCRRRPAAEPKAAVPGARSAKKRK